MQGKAHFRIRKGAGTLTAASDRESLVNIARQQTDKSETAGT